MTDSAEIDRAEFTPFDCVAIIGVGMMGGSLGLAMLARGLARRIVGVDKHSSTLETARARGAITEGTQDAVEAVRAADGIVLATPVGVIPGLLERIAPHVRPDALVTDLGSTKSRIVEAGERWFGNRFVGGHPMAGSEASGIEASQSDLFTGAAWILTRAQPFVLEEDAVASRWAACTRALDARPIALNAPRHDRLVALVSHLPHLLSFAFARTIEADAESAQARELAGGSFRDFMRVSRADPALWQDILLENRGWLLNVLSDYERELHALKTALTADDAATLRALLSC